MAKNTVLFWTSTIILAAAAMVVFMSWSQDVAVVREDIENVESVGPGLGEWEHKSPPELKLNANALAMAGMCAVIILFIIT